MLFEIRILVRSDLHAEVRLLLVTMTYIFLSGERTKSPTDLLTTGLSIPAKLLAFDTRSTTRSSNSLVPSGGRRGSIRPIDSII